MFKKPYYKKKIRSGFYDTFILGVYNLQRSPISGEIEIHSAFLDNFDYDTRVANKLGMYVHDYHNLMVEKFNAQIIKPNKILRYIKSMLQVSQLYFLTKKDAEKALDWINAFLMIKELQN